MLRVVRPLSALALLSGMWAGFARAEAPAPEPPASPAPPACLNPPPPIRKHAGPSDTGSYVGYYVGGGVPCLGEPRCPTDGTWGWDYSGLCFTRHVILFWTHGRLYQGGTGAYKADGPHLLHSHEHEEEKHSSH